MSDEKMNDVLPLKHALSSAAGFIFGGVFIGLGIASWLRGDISDIYVWATITFPALGLGIANLMILQGIDRHRYEQREDDE